MSSERAHEVMRLYLEEVLAGQRFELIPDFVAEHMVDHTRPGERGPAALDAHARGFCANIPDAQITVERIFATPDTAVGIWRWEGTPKQHMGVSATGNNIYPSTVASIFQLADGMLTDYRAFVDAVEIREQVTAPASDD